MALSVFGEGRPWLLPDMSTRARILDPKAFTSRGHALLAYTIETTINKDDNGGFKRTS